MSDDTRFNASVVKGFIACSRCFGWVLVIMSLAVLGTWVSGAGPLRALVQAQGGTHAGAALGILLGAAALLLGRRAPRASIALSAAMLALGSIGLLEVALGRELMAWRWLDGSLPAWPGRPPGGMAELTALCLTLLGLVGTAVVSGRMLWFREACALVVLMISLASSASYGLVLTGDSVMLLHRVPIMTTAMLLILSLAWMASVPTTGLTRIAVSDSVGGAFARRLILPALLLPVLLTFLFKSMQAKLGMSEALALNLAAVATGGVVSTMILWVAFLLDRSERQRRTVISLREDASTDVLTGLANRRMFDATLAQALHDERADTSVLLMLDIDHFKKYNDRFGHPAGDEVLREAGRLLRTSVRLHDTVARYGGEEFIILLPHSDALRAERVGQRILEAFRANNWQHSPVTMSIGAAVGMPADTADVLVRRADAALYRSKQEGRDRLSFAAGAAGQALSPPLADNPGCQDAPDSTPAGTQAC